MKSLKILVKGMISGIGAVAPGLSGGILLVLLGLYQKTIRALGTLFKNFKENFKFLFPLVCGIGIGAVIFIKIMKFLLDTFPMQTKFGFFGLILGTIPMFYKEVTKKGYKKKYYLIVLATLLLGLYIFQFKTELLDLSTSGDMLRGLVIGLSYACSIAMPGIDSASTMSTFGVYDSKGGFIDSVDKLDFAVLIPAGIAVVVGILILSFFMNILLKKQYTITFSVIFGFFLSIVPSIMLHENDFLSAFGLNPASIISCVLLVIGVLASYFFSKIKKDDPDEDEEPVTENN